MFLAMRRRIVAAAAVRFTHLPFARRSNRLVESPPMETAGVIAEPIHAAAITAAPDVAIPPAPGQSAFARVARPLLAILISLALAGTSLFLFTRSNDFPTHYHPDE